MSAQRDRAQRASVVLAAHRTSGATPRAWRPYRVFLHVLRFSATQRRLPLDGLPGPSRPSVCRLQAQWSLAAAARYAPSSRCFAKQISHQSSCCSVAFPRTRVALQGQERVCVLCSSAGTDGACTHFAWAVSSRQWCTDGTLTHER